MKQWILVLAIGAITVGILTSMETTSYEVKSTGMAVAKCGCEIKAPLDAKPTQAIISLGKCKCK